MYGRPSVRFLLIALLIVVFSAISFSQIGISITVGPPALPVYEQPPCPAEGYIWTPGYWAYDYDGGDYYWVPGTWVEPPQVGFLWTPGYWGWGGDRFSMKATGVRMSVSMAASPTAMVISARATKAGGGTADASSTTVR